MKERQAMGKIPVSVIIPAKNEKNNIVPVINALKDWADEIFVVDSQSTDGMIETAEGLGAKVVQFHFNGSYPKKKNWALDNLPIRNEWVLIVDADGRVDPRTPVTWDYDQVTGASAYLVPARTLTVKGGVFTTIANQAESRYTYYMRGIRVLRSNVRIEPRELAPVEQKIPAEVRPEQPPVSPVRDVRRLAAPDEAHVRRPVGAHPVGSHRNRRSRVAYRLVRAPCREHASRHRHVRAQAHAKESPVRRTMVQLARHEMPHALDAHV